MFLKRTDFTIWKENVQRICCRISLLIKTMVKPRNKEMKRVFEDVVTSEVPLHAEN